MLRVWVLYDHKIGSKNQCLALAEALRRQRGASVETKSVKLAWPWRWLAPSMQPLRLRIVRGDDRAHLAPPWPDVVIASGSKLAVPALAIKAASGMQTLAIQILDPQAYRRRFDAIITPQHDRLSGDNVITILGALADVDQARLAEGRALMQPSMSGAGPHVSVMIGGPNKEFDLDLASIAEPVDQLLASGAGRVYLCSSPRSPAAVMQQLHERFSGRSDVWVRQDHQPNPYTGLLALSDLVCVTQDSVNMMSEAARLGLPVISLPLPAKRGAARLIRRRSKFAAFHAAMQQAGHVRPWSGQMEVWQAPRLDDMATALQGLDPLLTAWPVQDPAVGDKRGG